MTCEVCGLESLRKIYVGAVGMCPSCHAGTKASNDAHAIITDDIPGGQIIENLGHEPMTFYSKKAILAEADRRGLRLRDKWAGPGDKYMTNPAAYIDAQTLENARVLVTRGSSTAEDVTWKSWETHTRVGTLSELTK